MRWLSNTYKHVTNLTQLRHRNGLKNNIVKDVVLGNDGNQYIGTYSGLSIYNPNTQTYKHVTISQTSQRGNKIEVLTWGQKNILWIGTRDGLYRYQLSTKRIQEVKGFDKKMIWDITPDKEGKGLWVGTDKGLFHLAYHKDSIRSIKLLKSEITEGKNVRVNTIMEDSHNRLWVGTDGDGLFRMDLASYPDSVKTMTFLDNNTSTSLIDGYIYSLFETKEHDIWIGSQSGLYRYSEYGTFHDYTSKGTKANNIIKGICEDSKQRLWLTTHQGIAVLDPTTGKKRYFNTHDGMRSNIFNIGACKITDDDRLLAGSLKGLVILDLNPLMEKSHTFPKQYVHSISVNNQKVYANRVINGKVISKVAPRHVNKLTLESEQNNVSFVLESVEMNHPNRILWAYRVKEFEDAWKYLPANQHTISFFSLTKGKYHLEYRSTNHVGEWNQQAGMVEIAILPHWSQTYWAYSLYFLLSLLGLIYLFNIQKRKIKVKESLEHERKLQKQALTLEKEKNEFFINISNELKEPMVRIASPLKKLREQGQELTPDQRAIYTNVMHKNVELLNERIEQLLNLSMILNGNAHLQLGFHNVSQLTQQTVAKFMGLAVEKNISLSFSDTTTLGNVVCDRNAIEIILSNLLSNAIKYSTHGGFVRVSISIPSTKNYCYCISVQDQGIGISEEQQKDIFKQYTKLNNPKSKPTGVDIGLAYTKSLVDLHKGEIKVESKLNEGSRFSVFLPTTLEYHLQAVHSQEQDGDKFGQSNDSVSQPNDEFLLKVEAYIEANLSSPELTVEHLAEAMNLSSVHLYRRLKSLTNTTPNDFIKNIRMDHATRMLSEGSLNVSEIAYAIGFNDPKYFSKCFKSTYGMSPTTYQRIQNNKKNK